MPTPTKTTMTMIGISRYILFLLVFVITFHSLLVEFDTVCGIVSLPGLVMVLQIFDSLLGVLLPSFKPIRLDVSTHVFRHISLVPFCVLLPPKNHRGVH